MNFETWFASLISDQRWVELLRHYRDDTIKKAGEKVFAQLVADSTVEVRPMSENRKHVYNILCKNPGDKPTATPWHVQAAINIANAVQDEWKAVSPEERTQRLKEWEDMVKNSQILNSMPKPSYKQLAEEGGVLPPKPAPYPCTSKEELYVKQRHFEYLKANFEARTGQKLPTWVSEESWNIIYDENHLTDKGL